MQIHDAADLELLPPALTHLSLSLPAAGGGLTDEMVARIEAARGLTHLALSAARLSDAGLARILDAHPGIRHLSIRGAPAVPAALFGRPLEVLSLNKCDAVGAAALRRLITPGLRELYVFNCDGLRGKAMAGALRGGAALERVRLLNQRVGRSVFEALAALPALEQLDVVVGPKGRKENTPKGLFTALSGSARLRRLRPDRPLGADEAAALAGAPSLEQIWLPIAGPGDVSAAAPLGGARLTVSFSAPAVTDALLGALPQHLPGIESLDLAPGAYASRGLRFGRVGLEAVRQLARLEHLSASGSFSLKNADVAPLAGHPLLVDLDLGGCSKLTSGVVGTVTSLPALRRLSLRGCKLSNASLKKLGRLSLERLAVGDARKIGDAGLVGLAANTRLQALQMGHYIDDVGDPGLEALSRLPALEELYIDLGTVGQAGVAALGEMRSLRTLHISSKTAISDSWLETLGGLPRLETLSVSVYTRAGGVSAEGVAALARAPALTRLDIPQRGLDPAFQHQIFADTGTRFTTTGNSPSFFRACPPIGWRHAPDWS